MRAPVLFLLATALGAAACDSPTDFELPDQPPAIEGPIVARDVPTSFSDGEPTIHVKSGTDDPCGIIFVVDDGTDIVLRMADGSPAGGRIADLTEGSRVRVWARGAIADSCPGQGGAEAVEVLGG